MQRTNEIAGIDKVSQEILKDYIKEYKCKKILEVGMADGMSSIAILQALNDNFNGEGSLTSIDPHQSSYWNNNGIKNIKHLNLQKNHTLIEKYDYIALPELLSKGEKYDLIFIDGSHIFDSVIHNNFYCDMLLKVGGILINDDMWMPAIKKAFNYIKNNYPHLEVIDTSPLRFTPIFKKIKNREYLGWDYHVNF